MSEADHSFVLDAGSFAAMEDYAIVGQQESKIRPLICNDDISILDDNKEKESQEEHSMTVKTEFRSPPSGNMFGLGRRQQLLYADVDCKDPEHKNIRQRVAAEGCLEEESKKSKDAREKLITHMAKKLQPNGLSVGEANEWMAKERAHSAELLKHTPGILPESTLEYLLRLGDEECRETLNIISGQHLRMTQRPWDADLPDDGISFSGRPDLIERYWKVYSDIQKKEHEKDLSAFGYRVLITWSATQFVCTRWHLFSVKQVKDNGAYALNSCDNYLWDRSAFKPQGRQYIMMSLADVKLDRKTQFIHLQGLLEMHESFTRQDMVKVEEAGREVAIQNAAKLYGRLLESLRSFSLDPKKEI
ncbi:MAG: hypothetical protein Q9212_005561 [Teloschistes hypoglaucus]